MERNIFHLLAKYLGIFIKKQILLNLLMEPKSVLARARLIYADLTTKALSPIILQLISVFDRYIRMYF